MLLRLGARIVSRTSVPSFSSCALVGVDVGQGLRSFSSVEDKDVQNIGNEAVRKLADQILGLTVLECSWLSEILRKKLKIEKSSMGAMPMMAMMPSAATGPAAPAAPVEAPAPEVKAEKTVFNIKLESFTPEGKIRVIKEVRAITGLGLKEAKDLVEKAPIVIKEHVPKADADNLKKLIETAGGKVDLE